MYSKLTERTARDHDDVHCFLAARVIPSPVSSMFTVAPSELVAFKVYPHLHEYVSSRSVRFS